MSRINSVSLLHPTFGDRLWRLMRELGPLGFGVFETVRAPERQSEMLAGGRSHAGPYQSAHQFGLAADIVVAAPEGWKWPPADDPVWAPIATLAPKYGLETLSFERPHVQQIGFNKWRHKLAAGPMDTPGWMAWLEQRNKETT